MCQRGTFTHARPSFYHSPPLRVPPSAALSVAASATRPLSVPPPPPAAVSVAAVSAAATIAFSADIAAALIVVCPRCCLCFRLPPPVFPAPAIATAAVCRRHCQCCRHHHRHRRPCSFCRHRCRHCLFFCRCQHCLYVLTFPTASMFQRFRRRGRRCLCFDRHRHNSSSLQVVRR